MSLVNFQFAPISVSTMEARMIEALDAAAHSRITKGPTMLKYLIEAQPEWFTDEAIYLLGEPIKIFEWLENLYAKHAFLKNTTLQISSTYVRSLPSEEFPNHIVCHLDATINGRKPIGDEKRYKATVRTPNRFTTLTPSLVSVKDVNDRIPLATHSLSLMPDGTTKWVRTFFRQPTPLSKVSYFCPTTARAARNRLHSLIGHFTGHDSVESYFHRWFSDISAVQEVMDGPTKLDQALMQQDVIEFFATEHTEEEITAFIESIKVREIEAGVSKLFTTPKNALLVKEATEA